MSILSHLRPASTPITPSAVRFKLKLRLDVLLTKIPAARDAAFVARQKRKQAEAAHTAVAAAPNLYPPVAVREALNQFARADHECEQAENTWLTLSGEFKQLNAAYKQLIGTLPSDEFAADVVDTDAYRVGMSLREDA